MTTVNILAGGPSGGLESNDATYATARSGSGLVLAASTTSPQVGQQLGYALTEVFLDFDTSAIPVGSTGVSAVLSLNDEGDSSTTDFTMRARLYDFGASLSIGDWVPGASLSSYTLLAHKDTSGWGAGYNAFTDDAMGANIVLGGHTRIVLASSRLEAGTTPGGNEFCYFDCINVSTGAELVVTYTAPTPPAGGLGFPVLGGGFFP